MPEAGVLPAQVLGFDFGTRRIGVASGQAVTALGAPLAPVPARDGIPDWAGLDALVADWQPQALIVGRPLNMDGTESEISHLARKFARRLAARYPKIPVYNQDERLSTREARETLADVGRQRGGRLPSLDSTAACHIIASWYAQPNWQRV
ncbi:MAG: Holliday junction resolvase RuvX [Perlucidibaca sp.]